MEKSIPTGNEFHDLRHRLHSLWPAVAASAGVAKQACDVSRLRLRLRSAGEWYAPTGHETRDIQQQRETEPAKPLVERPGQADLSPVPQRAGSAWPRR